MKLDGITDPSGGGGESPRPCPTRVGSVNHGHNHHHVRGSSPEYNSVFADLETFVNTPMNNGGTGGGGRLVNSQPQTPSHHVSVRRSPSHSRVRRNPSSNRLGASTKDGVARSQSMRTARRPQSLDPSHRFRQRIASIPGDLIINPAEMVAVNGVTECCAKASSNQSLPLPGDEADVMRLRNFAVTSKGIINRGDSFRSKSRSTHSVASNGSGHKLAVPTLSTGSCVNSDMDLMGMVASTSVQQPPQHIMLQQQPPPIQQQPTPIPSPVGASALTATLVDGRYVTQVPTPRTEDGSVPPVIVTTTGGEATSPEMARYRVLVVGAFEVGKSSLTRQFMTSEYICAYDSSLESPGGCFTNVEVGMPLTSSYNDTVASLHLHHQNPSSSTDEDNEKTVTVVLNGEESELVFVEHSSLEELKSPVPMYNNPDAYLVVYSVASRSSFLAAKDYLNTIKRSDNLEAKAAILVGNKTDLVRLRTVSTDDGRSLATHEGVKFIETSAGIDHHVDELLAGILHQIRLKQNHIFKEMRKRDSIKIKGRGHITNSSFSACRAKGIIKRFLRKACSRSKSCDNLHVL